MPQNAEAAIIKLEAGLAKFHSELEKANLKGAKKQWLDVMAVASDLRTQFESLDGPQKKVLQDYDDSKEEAEKSLDRLTLLIDARGHITRCLDPMQKLRAQLEKPQEKQDGAFMEKQIEVLLERAEPVKSNNKFHQFEEIAKLLRELEALEPQVQEQAAAALTFQAMTEAVTECERLRKEVERCRSRKQGRQALTTWTKLKIAAEVLTGVKGDLFMKYEQVQEFLKKYEELAPTIEEEARGMIHEEEANEVLDKVQRPLSHAFIFAEKGDRTGMDTKRREVLEIGRTLIDDPFGYYAPFPQVQKFQADYHQLQKLEVDEKPPADPPSRPLISKQSWKPDCAACSICSKEFTFTRRRHHCRVCGCVACDKCCPKPALTDQNRVCVKCA